MPEKKPTWQDIERDRDKPVKLPLEAEEAMRGLLAVDPEDKTGGSRIQETETPGQA